MANIMAFAAALLPQADSIPSRQTIRSIHRIFHAPKVIIPYASRFYTENNYEFSKYFINHTSGVPPTHQLPLHTVSACRCFTGMDPLIYNSKTEGPSFKGKPSVLVKYAFIIYMVTCYSFYLSRFNSQYTDFINTKKTATYIITCRLISYICLIPLPYQSSPKAGQDHFFRNVRKLLSACR